MGLAWRWSSLTQVLACSSDACGDDKTSACPVVVGCGCTHSLGHVVHHNGSLCVPAVEASSAGSLASRAERRAESGRAPVVHRRQTPEALLPCRVPDLKLDDVLLCTHQSGSEIAGAKTVPMRVLTQSAPLRQEGGTCVRGRRRVGQLRAAHLAAYRDVRTYRWWAPCWPGSHSGRNGARRTTCRLRIHLLGAVVTVSNASSRHPPLARARDHPLTRTTSCGAGRWGAIDAGRRRVASTERTDRAGQV